MCVQVTKTANRFEISSLLEKILLKEVRWCLTFVGLYIYRQYTNIVFILQYNLPKKNVIQFNNKKKDNGIPIDTPIVIPVRGVA